MRCRGVEGWYSGGRGTEEGCGAGVVVFLERSMGGVGGGLLLCGVCPASRVPAACMDNAWCERGYGVCAAHACARSSCTRMCRNAHAAAGRQQSCTRPSCPRNDRLSAPYSKYRSRCDSTAGRRLESREQPTYPQACPPPRRCRRAGRLAARASPALGTRSGRRGGHVAAVACGGGR